MTYPWVVNIWQVFWKGVYSQTTNKLLVEVTGGQNISHWTVQPRRGGVSRGRCKVQVRSEVVVAMHAIETGCIHVEEDKIMADDSEHHAHCCMSI